METTQATVLDCGHLDDWGPGFAAYDGAGKRYCKACAFEREREAFRTAERVFSGYVSRDERSITDWGGRARSRSCSAAKRKCATRRRGGRYDRFTAHARDEWGRTWSVVGQGAGMVCTLRRIKGK